MLFCFACLSKKEKKERTKLTILSGEDAQNSDFRSFFERNGEAIKCFRDLLTFRVKHFKKHCIESKGDKFKTFKKLKVEYKIIFLRKGPN